MYGLTLDRREADVLERVLSSCSSTELVVRVGGNSPPSSGTSSASRNDASPTDVDALGLWDDNRNGRITCAEARRHGIAPVPFTHPAYPFMRDGETYRPLAPPQALDHVRDRLGISERRACRVLEQHRSTQRRIPRGRDDEDRLVADMIELAHRCGRYGYRRLAALLRDADWQGQRQAGRAPVAAREAEGARQATEAGPALAERRLLRPAARRVGGPRMVL